MTLIYGNKSWLWADRKVSQSHLDCSQTTKIFRLQDWTLIWTAWFLIEKNLILELYAHFLKENPNWIDSIVMAINFINTIKDNCNYEHKWNKIENEYIIINDKVQVIFYSKWLPYSLENSLTPWYIAIGSWCEDFEKLQVISNKKYIKLEPEDIFELVSLFDSWTWKDFEFLPYEKK